MAQIQIGEVAERTGLSITTLRHYDQAGLVTPSERSPGGFRLYNDTDVERLLLIRRMKPIGFTVEQMAELLGATDELNGPKRLSADRTEQLRATVHRYEQLARTKKAKLEAELAYAEEFIDTLAETAGLSTDDHQEDH